MDSNEQVAPEESRMSTAVHELRKACHCLYIQVEPSSVADDVKAKAEAVIAENESLRAALAKQSSPPNARLCKGCQTPLDESGAQSVDGWIYHKRCVPSADTDERARGAQVEGIIEDWIAANPSLVGELEIQIVRDLSDRISAALVEKEREVWDRAIATAKETAKRLGQGDDYIAAQQVNGVLRTIDALIAARTSEREK